MRSDGSGFEFENSGLKIYLPCPPSRLTLRAPSLFQCGGLGWGSKVWYDRAGFRIQDSGFRIQGSGFRVQDSGFKIQCATFARRRMGFMGSCRPGGIRGGACLYRSHLPHKPTYPLLLLI